MDLPFGTYAGRGALISALRLVMPLVGVLALGWDPAHLVGFWFVETVVVGIVNVPRILISRGPPDPDEQPQDPTGIVAAPFFAFHYGAFVSVQGVFLAGMLGPAFQAMSFLTDPRVWTDAAVCLLVEVFDLAWRGVWLGERFLYSPVGQMFRPYPRIFIQQFTVLVGGWAAIATGWWSPGDQALGVLVVLLALRGVAEVFSPAFDASMRSHVAHPG